MRKFACLLVWNALAVPLLASDPPPADERSRSEPVLAELASAEPLRSFMPDEFLLMPLRIHVLRADEVAAINAEIEDTDLSRIVSKANRIWQAAGIRFVIESVVREPAVDQERFALAESLGASNLGRYLTLRPESSRSDDLLHVYYVHEMEVNGVFLGGGVSFVKETAKLRPVEGGIDEPVPRVMSHELGHAFGLVHRQDRTNLMASGTTGTSLNAAEVERAREVAGRFPFAQTASALAERAKEHFEAGRWYDAFAADINLLHLPGCSPLKEDARARIALSMSRLLG